MHETPKVFISYSHDSDTHRERVLALSERLRQDGIETILDSYVNGSPPEGWPRWILNGLDAADRVLVICTPTYYRRFRGQEVHGQGKWVDWEGAVITQALYDAKSRGTRFIPMVFAPADQDCIPEPLRGQSWYCLTSETAYRDLYDALLEQAGVEPGALGALKRRPRERVPPMRFDDVSPAAPDESKAARVHLSHLPAGAPHFLGRGPELAALDAAWSVPGAISPTITPTITVAELIAPGGTGKTALVKRWLEGVKAAGWGGAARVFGWSFYSQGTGDDRQASEDLFLATALKWFEVDIDPASHPADKGQALAEAIARQRTLLILDGLEPLQHPPGPLAGELRAPGLKALLGHLAGAGQPGLCVITTRERVTDLSEWVRTDAHPNGAVLRLDLGNLSEPDGARLLHTLGANRAGAAALDPDDSELHTASREVRGHALTLSLLGRYLARVKAGDIRCRHEVGLIAADRDARGHAARVIGAYETWFARAGSERSHELAVLRLLGLFDRPAAREDLASLRAAPPIPGLTEALQGLGEADWTATLANLADCGLAAPDRATGALDAHPLVRECLAASLRTRAPAAWQEGHRRLYERLKGSVPHRPEGLAGLQPLYQAVAHGCLAGLYQEACVEVYIDRIQRGTGDDGYYSGKVIGAIGADLGTIASLFAEPWTRPAPDLSEPAQGWLLNEAAFCLRALGRLGEALGPMRAGAELAMKQEEWRAAAISYGNLSELGLSLGQVAAALTDAGQAVDHADRSGDAAQRMSKRTTLADALHQQGETGPAAARFAEAEALQAKFQPQYPLLYSVQGFRYCDLLLAGSECAAWGGELGAGAESGARGAGAGERGAECEAVAGRAGQTLAWAVANSADLLTIALDHLTLARCALYADRLQGQSPSAAAQDHTEQAVTGLRAAGAQHHLPRGLLTRAWLRHALGDAPGARADLAEVERIATRGAMALHLADLALTRARLFHDRAALTAARRLIETHGYGRRLPELADAETAAAAWPAAPSR